MTRRRLTHLISRFNNPFLANPTFNFQVTRLRSPKLPFHPRLGIIPVSPVRSNDKGSGGHVHVFRSGIWIDIGILSSPLPVPLGAGNVKVFRAKRCSSRPDIGIALPPILAFNICAFYPSASPSWTQSSFDLNATSRFDILDISAYPSLRPSSCLLDDILCRPVCSTAHHSVYSAQPGGSILE